MSNEKTSRYGKVSFIRMDEGCPEDRAIISKYHDFELAKAADRCLKLLLQLKSPDDEVPWAVDRYTHSLQTATRAYRDKADEETVVVALLHDVGDAVSLENHALASAEILRPFVSDANYWMVKHHGLFQTYYYYQALGKSGDKRKAFEGHTYYEMTVNFCGSWDQMSFDPDYDTLPLEFFEPMVRRVFAKPKKSEGDIFNEMYDAV